MLAHVAVLAVSLRDLMVEFSLRRRVANEDGISVKLNEPDKNKIPAEANFKPSRFCKEG